MGCINDHKIDYNGGAGRVLRTYTAKFDPSILPKD